MLRALGFSNVLGGIALGKTFEERVAGRLEAALFEAGALLSKSITWMLVVSGLLLLMSWGIAAEAPIKVPVVDLELERPTAVAVVLVMYAFSYLRYIVLINQQKYIFWELAEVGGYYQKKVYPWQSLNPSPVNAVLYHAYMRPESVNPRHVAFSVFLSLLFALAPVPAVIYLLGAFDGQWVVLLCFGLAFVVYAYAGKHYFEYIERDRKQRDKVRGYFDEEPADDASSVEAKEQFEPDSQA